jgi:hypothetical protein
MVYKEDIQVLQKNATGVIVLFKYNFRSGVGAVEAVGDALVASRVSAKHDCSENEKREGTSPSPTDNRAKCIIKASEEKSELGI